MTNTVGTMERQAISGGNETGPPRWSRLASVGLAMAAAGPALMIAAALIWGLDTDDLGFFVVPTVAGVGAVALMRQRRTWMRVVAIVLGVAIGVLLFWTMFGLASPASFFDFVPGILVMPGALIGLVAGIASIRSGRRGLGGPSSTERRAVQVVVVALGVLVAASAVISVAARDTVSDADAAGADLVVELSDFEFSADEYEVAGGATVLVTNSDPFLHTFTIDALGIDVTLNGGSEKLVSIPAEPGTYVLYCDPHTADKDDPGEDDMAASLTVG